MTIWQYSIRLLNNAQVMNTEALEYSFTKDFLFNSISYSLIFTVKSF